MKMTIYVPDDLKRKMERVKDANWSALACRAFQNHLAELSARKGAVEMGLNDVVTRLRGSRNLYQEEIEKSGFAAGVDWAKKDASVDELTKLEAARDATRSEEWGFGDGESAYSAGEQLVMMMDPDASRGMAAEFWEHILGEDESKTAANADFVEAFAAGAMSIWENVKDQL